MKLFRSFLQDESGQEAVEYALIFALIVFALLGLLTQSGLKSSNSLSQATAQP